MSRTQPIGSPDDQRIAAYRHLKDRDVARQGRRFIAEGELVVRRLLESDFAIESVLLAQRRAEEIAPLVPANVPVYVAPDAMMRQIVGFKFHSGVIACGVRKTPASLDDVMPRLPLRATLLVCPNIANTENLGGLVRVAAGFGADAMLLGEQSCDPFYRRSIRVSMGAVFQLPVVQSQCFRDDLGRLKDRWGFELAAAVLDDNAEHLSTARRGPRLGLLFGNEVQGLPHETIAACHRRITIPMKLGTDSLNVVIAAAVFLYHFTR